MEVQAGRPVEKQNAQDKKHENHMQRRMPATLGFRKSLSLIFYFLFILSFPAFIDGGRIEILHKA
jgi:hypothetical protein